MQQRVTANGSAAYSRANCAVVTKSVLRRTTLAPEKYDPSSILLDIAQGRINKGWKRMQTSTANEEFMRNDRVSFVVTSTPSMTYVVEDEVDTL